MNKKSAFTLIELLVFFVVAAIFATIAIPQFLSYQKKIRLTSSVEIVRTALYKSFSSARSRPKFFIASGISGENQFQTFECEIPNCLTRTNINVINLRSNVFFDDDFSIRFVPPHGDPDFVGDELNISLNYDGQQKRIIIYKKSGLIANED